MRADHLVTAVATPVGAGFLYFLFADEVSASEAIACAGVVLAASVYAFVLQRSGTRAMQLPARGAWSVLRAFGAVVPDGWRVGRALLQAMRRRPADTQGVITHVPFRTGGRDAADAGRRATVVTAVSLAPNGFVIGVDRERDELIVHQLMAEPVGGDREWPS